MTDRATLEAAAKAAGVAGEYESWTGQGFAEGIRQVIGGAKCAWPWNPLRDDGQALRLACELSMTVEFLPDAVRCRVPGGEWIGETLLPFDRAHLGAATRRAITRTAATLPAKRTKAK